MKLASLKSSSCRDGELCVVNRELTSAVKVGSIAKTMQDALDRWQEIEAPLREIYQALNKGEVAQSFPFDETKMSSPLPRAYQWLDGSAYVNHVELVRKARGATIPANFWTDPLMYQGGSDSFLGPREPIKTDSEAYGIDFEAEVAIITDDVPMGTSSKEASKHIKLVMLVNDVSLRNLIPEELGKGFGFVQSKPASSFSPIALTLDELENHWHEGRVQLPLLSKLNGEFFGQPNAGVDMIFSFPELIAHAAKTRHLAAGTIIGSGTVSNLDRSQGSSCIVEKRMLELLAEGKPKTPFMHFGDSIRIEMLDSQGRSLFGAIEQIVQPFKEVSN